MSVRSLEDWRCASFAISSFNSSGLTVASAVATISALAVASSMVLEVVNFFRSRLILFLWACSEYFCVLLTNIHSIVHFILSAPSTGGVAGWLALSPVLPPTLKHGLMATDVVSYLIGNVST